MKKILVPFFIIWILIGVFYISGSNKTSSVTKSTVISVPSPISIPHLDSMKIYNLVNDYRASQGLNKLAYDPSMCVFAKKRLQEIHTNWSHQGFYPEILSFYQYTDAGENLAKEYHSEQQLLSGWINSPSHLEQMIRPVYTRTCIETDSNYVVQEFASY